MVALRTGRRCAVQALVVALFAAADAAAAPGVGEPAPDFTLERLGSEEVETLSRFRGRRPVGLIFGSFT